MSTTNAAGWIGRSFETLKHNFSAFFLISLLASILSLVGELALLPDGLATFSGDPEELAQIAESGTQILLFAVLSLILFMLASGAITFGAVRFLEGAPATVGECLGRGLSVTPALIGVGLLIGVGTALALGLLVTIAGPVGVLLFLPIGAFIVVACYVVVPALVNEGTGVIGSIQRSLALTAGARWKIFGLIALIFFMMLILGIIVGLVIQAFGDGIGMGGYLIAVAADAVTVAFGAVASAVVYLDLRREDEPMGEVFD